MVQVTVHRLRDQVAARVLVEIIKVVRGIVKNLPVDHPATGSLVKGLGFLEDGTTTLQQGAS